MSLHYLLYHIVFRTKGSMLTINEEHERELFGYINGFCTNKNCKLFRVNGMPDHIHLLLSIPPDQSISQFIQVLKAESSKWLKLSPSFPHFIGWANGFAVFSYARRDYDTVRNYIMNQKIHHKSINFKEEYNSLLAEFGIDSSKDRFFED